MGDFVKTMTTECARLMNAMAQGMKEVQSRTDPNAQLFVRALSTCGQFMTSLTVFWDFESFWTCLTIFDNWAMNCQNCSIIQWTI